VDAVTACRPRAPIAALALLAPVVAAAQAAAAPGALCPAGTELVRETADAARPSQGSSSLPVYRCIPVQTAPALSAPAPATPAPATPAQTTASTPRPQSQPAKPEGGGGSGADAAAEGEARRAAAERALERMLVEQGGLVVEPGGVELVPEIGFSYSDGSAPAGSIPDAGGMRIETFTGTLTLRVGLPLRLQAEAKAPFLFERLTPTGDDLSPPREGRGFGDARLGLTWQVLRGHAHVPDLLVGGFWKSRSGRTAFDDTAQPVPLGTGVEQFGGTMTLVKAIDPVVLVATGMFAWSAPRWVPQGWLQAGNQFGASTAAVLAVSPQTSLSFALEASHTRPLALDRVTLYRTDRTSAVFRVGVSTAVSRRSFFQVNLGMGLTADVPRFEVSLSTPIQI
jgi:hypothetical protein